MTTSKRGPGRPRGTGIPDGRELDAVANLMVRNPGLRKTTAINQVVRERYKKNERPAAVRRLLRKWDKDSAKRLADAEQRQAEHYAQSHSAASHGGLGSVALLVPTSGYEAMLERAREAIGLPIERLEAASQNALAAMQPLYQLAENPAFQSALDHIQPIIDAEALWRAAEAAESVSFRMALDPSIVGTAQAMAERLQTSELQKTIERALGPAAQMQRMLDQIDPLRRFGF